MSARARERGELALVLHSHMPYVEGFGTWPFGEEWLFEALATSYLPLLELLERWAEEGLRQVVTVGVTPVLADQLALPEVGERFVGFVCETRERCHHADTEALEHAGDAQAAAALRHSARVYRCAAERFELLGRDPLGALCRLHDAGTIELWGSCATHALLPLLATEAGLHLQVLTGVDAHRRRFGRWSGGFWLPECAYRDGIDEQLGSAGVRAFCIDQTCSAQAPDQLEPVATPAGPIAVPLDWRLISLVWDNRGYPSDPAYRDYHALSPSGLRPHANGGGAYVPEAGLGRARQHAQHFVSHVLDRLDRYRVARGRPGLVVVALDTELLGHWWHEGVAWLSAVVEEAHSAGLALATLPEAIERHEPRARRLCESSWGAGKDLRTWDSPGPAELVWLGRRAELGLVAALARLTPDGPLPGAARRAARELLALQSSDWAFMATRSLAAGYPLERARDHAAQFEQALARLARAVRDFPAVPPPPEIDAGLRGLAPWLSLAPLLAPASPWGRERLDGVP